jgi:hypothetical protein
MSGSMETCIRLPIHIRQTIRSIRATELLLIRRTIPITDLVAGTNVVEIGTDARTAVSNVNIVPVNVRGGVPVLPGSNNAYPGSSPTPSPRPNSGAAMRSLPKSC